MARNRKQAPTNEARSRSASNLKVPVMGSLRECGGGSTNETKVIPICQVKNVIMTLSIVSGTTFGCRTARYPIATEPRPMMIIPIPGGSGGVHETGYSAQA